MVKVEIDGKTLEVTPGSMIIEAADNNNIPIPRFCYHKKLSIAANCRMCLVEVEKAPKPLPACATPMTEGMKIWTKSPKAIEAQKAVMEFLLINHPLDCPICDQGGECELQDISLEYGNDLSRFEENKRVIKDKNLGPLVSTDMTRCILCTRCIRFGEEITGKRELGAIGRGAFTEVTTFITTNMESECSGNVIDLCPVGALTNKPFRFKARSWELKSFHSIAPHDCIGSNIYLHTRNQDVLRVVPRDNEAINEVWISDRDRYSIEGINHHDRLSHPMIKKNNVWQNVTWHDALEFIANNLKRISNDDVNNIGSIVSPNTTLEEQYLAQKLIRNLGSNNIDHRLRQVDFSAQDLMPLFPNLSVVLDELEQQDTVLLIGSNLPKEQPIAAIRLRKMAQKSGNLFILNPVDFAFSIVMPIASANKIIVHPQEILNELLNITKAVLNKCNKEKFLTPEIKVEVKELLASVKPNSQIEAIADKLLAGEKKLILLGTLVTSAPNYGQIIMVANLLATLLQAKLGILTYGANAAGAWLTGCVPHRGPVSIKADKTPKLKTNGLNTKEMLTSKQLKAYILLGVEPKLDCGFGSTSTETLKNAELVVAVSAFKTDILLDVATVLLPQTTFAKSSGTYVNITGHWQSVVGVAKPKDEARPLWKILTALGTMLGFNDFNFESSDKVLAEINKTITKEQTLQYAANTGFKLANSNASTLQVKKDITNNSRASKKNATNKSVDDAQEIFTRIALTPLYATDMLVRHAMPLQQTHDALYSHFARINSKMAKKLDLNDEELVQVIPKINSTDDANNMGITIKVKIDDAVLDNTAVIPQGIKETANLSLLEQDFIFKKVGAV